MSIGLTRCRSKPLSRDKRWVVESIVKREIRTADTGVADLKVEE